MAVHPQPPPLVGDGGGSGQRQEVRRLRLLLPQGRRLRAEPAAAAAGARPGEVQGLHPLPRLDRRRVHSHPDRGLRAELAADADRPLAQLPGQRLGQDGVPHRAQAVHGRGAREGDRDGLRRRGPEAGPGRGAEGLHQDQHLHQVGRPLVLEPAEVRAAAPAGEGEGPQTGQHPADVGRQIQVGGAFGADEPEHASGSADGLAEGEPAELYHRERKDWRDR